MPLTRRESVLEFERYYRAGLKLFLSLRSPPISGLPSAGIINPPRPQCLAGGFLEQVIQVYLHLAHVVVYVCMYVCGASAQGLHGDAAAQLSKLEATISSLNE